MNPIVREQKKEVMEKYKQIMELYSDPYKLSLALEQDEAKVPVINGAWIWEVIVKYFPLANRDDWKQYVDIVKKAIKICQERGIQIGIVPMKGKLSKQEKQWTENGFWWRVQKFPKIGRLTKNDAKMLQQHRYDIIGGLTRGGVNILKSAGSSDEESKKLFLRGSMVKLNDMTLLPKEYPITKQLEIKNKIGKQEG